MDDFEEVMKSLKEYNTRNPVDSFYVESEVMMDALEFANKLSGFKSNVLILGESGVGKEAMAKYIHCQSDRRKGPFMAINCSAIPGNLFESELFGYEKGGFTGADKARPGLLEEAKDGTIFLDEIGELPIEQQPKLLRFLETKTTIRVGGNQVFYSNARVICATNTNIQAKIEEKKFREDLYYRISTAEIHIPPLRERKKDIAVLANYFLNKLNKEYGLNKELADDAQNALQQRELLGNARELRNIIERMMINSTSKLMTSKDIEWKKHMTQSDYDDMGNVRIKKIVPMEEAIEELERKLLAMGKANNMSSRQLAELLKIDQSTVVRKLKKYNL